MTIYLQLNAKLFKNELYNRMGYNQFIDLVFNGLKKMNSVPQNLTVTSQGFVGQTIVRSWGLTS